jgi:peptidyl-dipeptidase Dcp
MSAALISCRDRADESVKNCSDSYSAGYYSYLWADVITADGSERLLKPADRTIERSPSVRKYILSVGNTIDPAEAFQHNLR